MQRGGRARVVDAGTVDRGVQGLKSFVQGRWKLTALIILFAIIAIRAITVVPAGHVGVVDFFGTVSPNTLKAGINLVNPLAHVVKFSVKTQELKEVMDVPSKEGLTVQLEVSALFHLNPEKAAEVYKTIGPNYAQIVLEPQFRSVSRGVTAGYEAKALYTSERELLANEIQQHLAKIVEPRGITIETTPLRRVGLPPGLSESIAAKLPSRQETLRLTLLVIFVSLFVALYIGGLDLAFTSLIQKIIKS